MFVTSFLVVILECLVILTSVHGWNDFVMLELLDFRVILTEFCSGFEATNFVFSDTCFTFIK